MARATPLVVRQLKLNLEGERMVPPLKYVGTVLSCSVALLCLLVAGADACTGIRLIAKDGSVVYGRTMEWGAFDLNSRVAIVPRGFGFSGHTPDGQNGKHWKGKVGFVAIDMLEKNAFCDGMNEKGLAVGLFYHPGFASYIEYDKSLADSTISAVDVVPYILGNFATVQEAAEGMKTVRVVGVVEPALGIPVAAHWMVVDRTGKSIVIEFLDGELRIFDNSLGVITNAPEYSWHTTNLRNYLNLSPVALPALKLENMDFRPLGAGTGMIGLPGDFTPPSRFVRAVAWTQTARPTETSKETIYEVFRILDNFNLPLGSAEGSNQAKKMLEGMRNSTIWTSAWDLKDGILYYHTQHNRRVRKLELTKLDFSKNPDTVVRLPLDKVKQQDYEDITPQTEL
jgi:choloylglycine hydrolase